ncbi:hypothetical protein VNI00_012118 [Paramarasmius palmivorus]|uniref:Uncharacterized protein n=1 Tax=Paramarasmius palmivorus TaxID=297713 RepID=A0AAW0C690_9AGAR
MHYKTCISGSLLVFATFASASPLEKRITWAPPIILPDENTVWRIGDLVNVTWDNSNPPEPVTNPNGNPTQQQKWSYPKLRIWRSF